MESTNIQTTPSSMDLLNDGYNVGDIKLYNIYSFVKYVKRGYQINRDDNWSTSGLTDGFIKEALKSSNTLRRYLSTLLAANLTIKRYRTFSKEDLYQLQKLHTMTEEHIENDSTLVGKFFSLLFHAGYFTQKTQYEPNSSFIDLTVPNLEVDRYIQDEFVRLEFVNHYAKIKELLRQIQKGDACVELKNFESSVANCIKKEYRDHKNSIFPKKMSEANLEDIIRDSLVQRKENERSEFQYIGVQVTSAVRDKADIMGLFNDDGLIIELKYNSQDTIYDALQQSLKYNQYFKDYLKAEEMKDMIIIYLAIAVQDRLIDNKTNKRIVTSKAKYIRAPLSKTDKDLKKMIHVKSMYLYLKINLHKKCQSYIIMFFSKFLHVLEPKTILKKEAFKDAQPKIQEYFRKRGLLKAGEQILKNHINNCKEELSKENKYSLITYEQIENYVFRLKTNRGKTNNNN